MNESSSDSWWITIWLNYSPQLNSLYSAQLEENYFYYGGTFLDSNDLVRTGLTEVKGNFRDYKPQNYILDKTFKKWKRIEKLYTTELFSFNLFCFEQIQFPANFLNVAYH